MKRTILKTLLTAAFAAVVMFGTACSDTSDSAPAPYPIDTSFITYDNEAKFIILPESDSVMSGSSLKISVLANVGHSVQDAVLSYDGGSLSAVAPSIGFRNAVSVKSLKGTKTATYVLPGISEFDPSKLSIGDVVKTYRVILPGGSYPQAYRLTDSDGYPLPYGIMSYTDQFSNTSYEKYVEVPDGKSFSFKVEANPGYSVYALQFNGDDTYDILETYSIELGVESIPSGTAGAIYYEDDCFTIPAPTDTSITLVANLYGIMPLTDAAVLDCIALLNSFDDPNENVYAMSTGEFSYEVVMEKAGDLYFKPMPVGKYNPVVTASVNGTPLADETAGGGSEGEQLSVFKAVFAGQTLTVNIHCSGGDELDYTLTVRLPQMDTAKYTNLSYIKVGDSVYAISLEEFSGAIAGTAASLQDYNISSSSGEITLTAKNKTTADKTTANTVYASMFVYNSDYYFQDFLSFGNGSSIDVSAPVEFTVESGSNGSYITFIYQYKDIKANFVIGLND